MIIYVNIRVTCTLYNQVSLISVAENQLMILFSRNKCVICLNGGRALGGPDFFARTPSDREIIRLNILTEIIYTSGIYPVIAWRVKDDVTYMAEGGSNDTGTTIKWAQKIGIIENPSESSELANSVKNTDGVCFIPSFSGLQVSWNSFRQVCKVNRTQSSKVIENFQAPVNDGLAAAGLIGIKPTTSKAHMIRAILESIVFRIEQLYQVMRSELAVDFKVIR